MSSRELRQLRLMKGALARAEAGTIGILETVNQLEALRKELREATESWHERFIEFWQIMEIIYAISVDRERGVTDAEHSKIAAALAGIDSLVEDALERTTEDS